MAPRSSLRRSATVASTPTRLGSGLASGRTGSEEADDDLATGRVTRYEGDEDFLAALDERLKPLDADP